MLAKPPFDLVERIRAHPPPYVILFVGVNGTGKTTTVAKVAAGSARRASGSRSPPGIPSGPARSSSSSSTARGSGSGSYDSRKGATRAAVAFDAIEHAKAKSVDVVLIDTAGRQHTNENLIEEAKKIRRVAQPALTLFVGDALSGNDVVEQAKLFQSALGIDGIVLTKLDADTKGGASLSLTFVTGKPIVLVGTGQDTTTSRRSTPTRWSSGSSPRGAPRERRLDVVLVRPKEDGNVGAVARAAKNFGVARLTLVAPRADLGPTARRRAMAGIGLLESARCLPRDLGSGLGRRSRGRDHRPLTGRSTAYLRRSVPPERLGEALRPVIGKVALVFGPEDNGLSRTELARCDLLVHVPARREFPTLNLSHAVAIVLYALHRARGTEDPESTRPRSSPSTAVGRSSSSSNSRAPRADRVPGHKRAGMVLLFRRVLGRATPLRRSTG